MREPSRDWVGEASPGVEVRDGGESGSKSQAPWATHTPVRIRPRRGGDVSAALSTALL